MPSQHTLDRPLRLIIGLLVFISPSVSTIIDQGDTGLLVFIIVLTLVLIPVLPQNIQLLKKEKILLFLLVLFFLFNLIPLLSGAVKEITFNGWIFYLFIGLGVPIYRFLRRLQINPGWLWLGLVLGCLSTGLGILISSMIHKALWGTYSFLFGSMALGGWNWFKNRRIMRVIPVMAFIFGFISFILSGSFFIQPNGFYRVIIGENPMALTGQFLGILAALAILIGYSTKQFIGALQHQSDQIRALGLGGIVLVAGIIYFSLTQSNLSQVIPLPFLIFFLIVWISFFFNEKVHWKPIDFDRNLSLSVIAITKNEEDRIEPCLESVSNWADEIIVFDSGSTDRTVELAKKYTDKVYVTDWPGYGPQKQRALEKAVKDWVLSIDADEQVTPELRVEIDTCLKDDPKAIAFRIPWAVHFLGKRLDFGRSGRAPLRLFKREGARFSDAQVHEKVILPSGKIGKLEGRLLHFSHRNMLQALEKFVQYSWLWAQQRHGKGKKTGIANALLHSCWEFFNIYVFRFGFLDGRRGLLMAILFWQYTFNKYASLWSLNIPVKKRK